MFIFVKFETSFFLSTKSFIGYGEGVERGGVVEGRYHGGDGVRR